MVKGIENGDYDVVYVIDVCIGEMCVVFYGKWDIDLYGKKLNRFGLYYNIVLLVVENNNIGEFVLNMLFNICYYLLLFLYKKGWFGWEINKVIWFVMISDFKEVICD